MRVWTTPACQSAAPRPPGTRLSGGGATVLLAARLGFGMLACGGVHFGEGAESAKAEAKPEAKAEAAANPKPESAATNLPAKTPPPVAAARGSTNGAPSKSGAKPEAKSEAGTKALALDYPSFRLIGERNIFNAERTRRRPRSPGSGPSVSAAQVTTVSLVGFLGSQLGDRAFFDSSSSTYRKAVKVGEAVGDLKLCSINPTGVVLETGERKISLKIGEQIRREESGPWKAPESRETAAAAGSTNSSAETTEAAAAESDGTAATEPAGGNSAAADEVLARLLKKRQQEEK